MQSTARGARIDRVPLMKRLRVRWLPVTLLLGLATACDGEEEGVLDVTPRFATVPSAVNDLAAVNVTSSSVTIRWTAVSDGAGRSANYALRRGSPTISWGPAAPTQVLLSGGGPVGETLSYTWTGLSPSTRYEFQLVPYTGVLGGDVAFAPLSNVAVTTTTSAAPPGEPGQVSDLAVQNATSTSVTIRWTAVSDGTGVSANYALRRASPTMSWGPAASSQVLIAGGGEVGTTLSYTWSGLSPSTQYEFQLVSYRGTIGGDVVFAPLSNVATVTTPAANSGNTIRITVDGLSQTPSTLTLDVGQTAQLRSVIRDASGNAIPGVITTWSSSNSSVARVTSSGSVEARASGNAIISATALGLVATLPVSVRDASPPGGGDGGGGDGGGSVVLDFYSDWSTATGQSVLALGDGGKWSSVLPLDGVSDVVSGSAYGWTRTRNVMRNRDTGTGQDGGAVRNTTYFPNRRSFYLRYWFYVSAARRGLNHTPSFPQSGALVWGWQYKSNGSGIEVGSGGGPSRNGNTEYRTRTGSYPLRPGTWYRFEAFIEFTSDAGGYARFRTHPRVYDMAGNLLFDDDDFTNEATGESLARVYSLGLWSQAPSSAANNARGFFIGNGEATFSGGGTRTELLYAAPALSTSGWIGSYIP